MKAFLSLLFYRLFLLALLPALLGFLLLKSRKNRQYRQRLFERLGFIDSALKPHGIIVHAASVGEVIALKNFIEQLLTQYPHLPITMTTFTPTGSEQVKKLFADRVQHCYLPLDIFFCGQLFLKQLQPQMMVFMETEIWPNLIAQAKNAGSQLLLINGRLSEHSIKGYQKFAWLIKPSLQRFDKICLQSEDNLLNYIKIGANQSQCLVTGNVKFDISITDTILNKTAELQQLLPTNRKIWLIASTHQGDEQLALSALKQIKTLHPELLLIMVPRHPERFKEVALLCQKQAFNLVKRSDNITVTEQNDIWLLDSLGELMSAYALADIITIGGSFSPIQGHNPLEPALFKKAIIVGPHMKNFTEINQQLLQQAGLIQLKSGAATELAETVSTLLTHSHKQLTLGNNAYCVVMTNQGASQRTLTELTQLLPNNLTFSSVGGNYYCYDHHLINNFSPKMFSSQYWQALSAITGSAQGRGTTWFIQSEQQHWVLRHYYRGGLIGKVINDHYVFTGLNNTRAAKEFKLLNTMAQWQLPAPKAIAFQVKRRRLFYQADLLSSRIENAQDLVAILSKKTVSEQLWQAIGRTIKRFHQQGIYHHDLNSHNILIDDNDKVWLIDFDRGEQRDAKLSWQQENLQRLLRSFRKEQHQLAQFNWQEKNWTMLMTGYQQKTP